MWDSSDYLTSTTVSYGSYNPLIHHLHLKPKCHPLRWGGLSLPQGICLNNPGINPRSLALQADSLPAEPQGKLKNAGVGSLSFLQQIFPTQELDQGLLHCRQILYQLSYQGSPMSLTLIPFFFFHSFFVFVFYFGYFPF